MNKKIINHILSGVACIGVICLPLTMGGVSFIDALTDLGLESLFEEPFTIALFASAVLAVIAFICSLTNNFSGCRICSWLGAVAMVLFVFLFGDALGTDLSDTLSFITSGTWIGIIGLIASAIVSGSVLNESNTTSF